MSSNERSITPESQPKVSTDREEFRCEFDLSSSRFHENFGLLILCHLPLNKQSHLHSSDEFASFIDILFCQIEQLIEKSSKNARAIFDNEQICIYLPDDGTPIDQRCYLAIDLARFLHQVNRITQWSLTFHIGIDWNSIDLISAEHCHGLAYDHARWLVEQCLLPNHLHVSERIYQQLKENPSFRFQTSSTINTQKTFFMFHSDLSKAFDTDQMKFQTSDMIDQLTRIQAEYYVDKHLGTMTLTKSLRRRSLVELPSKYLHWFTLNFKEKSLKVDFQMIDRRTFSSISIWILMILILIGTSIQSWIIDHRRTHRTFLFLFILLGFLFIAALIDRRKSHRICSNSLKCCFTLIISSLIFAQMFSEFIGKSSISFVNGTNSNATGPFFVPSREYYYHLTIASIYALYFSTISRSAPWLWKSLLIFLFSTVQISSMISLRSIVSPLHHYTVFTLILLHQLILILLSYIGECLEKSDFIWLKEIDDERQIARRQRDELELELSALLPRRVIDYYLNSDSNFTSIQHYHFRYNQMALLSICFHSNRSDDDRILMNFLQHIESSLKRDEICKDIVMHKKISMTELLFSMDIHSSNIAILSLVELLFQIEEHLKDRFQSKISLSACLHVARVNEIFIHFEKSPKIDLWTEDLSFVRSLMSHVPANHCLATKPVYQLLNDFYLFRTAGSIQRLDHQSNIYYLLGRLIGENIFQVKLVA